MSEWLCSTLVPCVVPLPPCVVPLVPCVAPLPPCVGKKRLGKWAGAIHVIQRVQCTVGVRVPVQAVHRQLPTLRQSRASNPSLPPLVGCRGSPGGSMSPPFGSASAVLAGVLPRVGPWLRVWSENVWTYRELRCGASCPIPGRLRSPTGGLVFRRFAVTCAV